MKNHKKHPPLTKPLIGEFCRNEVSLVGAPCGDIQRLFNKIAPEFSGLKVQYIDATHGEWEDNRLVPANEELETFPGGLSRTSLESFNQFDFKVSGQSFDLALVNGNHFHCSNQVVLLHPSKIDSLQRKTNRLTNIVAILNPEGLDIPEFLKEILDNDTPEYQDNIEFNLVNTIQQIAVTPKIKGLVLAGGRSSRMGADKGIIEYHGKPQRENVYNILKTSGIETYMSCRPDQAAELDGFNTITDRLTEMGPFGAIISAFMSDPNSAWLVVACDLPALSNLSINELLKKRNPSKLATAFQSPQNEFPEPLITIWEPKSYPRVLEFMALGYSCPRKVLINSDIYLIQHPQPVELQNINTPDELAVFDSSIKLSG